jgi:hypothetical protein
MSRGPRLVFGLLFAICLIAGTGGIVWLRMAGQRKVENALAGRGLSYQQRQEAVAEVRWSGLNGPGIGIEQVRLLFWPEPQLLAQGVDVDLGAMDWAASGGGGGDAAGWSNQMAQARVEDARVRWGEEVLGERISGQLYPNLALNGDGFSLKDGPQGPEIELRRRLTGAPLRGMLTARLRCADASCEGEIHSDALVLDDRRVAPGPLPAHKVGAKGTWERTSGVVAGELWFGEIRGGISGTLHKDPFAYDLKVVMSAVPLSSVVDVFGHQCPEGQRGEVAGTLGLEVKLQGQPLHWQAKISADGLRSNDVVPDLDGLRYGTFSWAAAGPQGRTELRQSGEGSPGWVGLRAAGLVPGAFQAAEDGSFKRHPGYDLAGIQLALDEAAAEGGWNPRGGSTITQQLAKNLFLNGRDRSLARKLRELLLALDMERNLRKERILELYINIVELGEGMYGIGPAADHYFLKQPGRLTPKESAFLATLLPSPLSGQRRARGGHTPDGRMMGILDNMALLGVIEPGAANRAKTEPLRLVMP